MTFQTGLSAIRVFYDKTSFILFYFTFIHCHCKNPNKLTLFETTSEIELDQGWLKGGVFLKTPPRTEISGKSL